MSFDNDVASAAAISRIERSVICGQGEPRDKVKEAAALLRLVANAYQRHIPMATVSIRALHDAALELSGLNKWAYENGHKIDVLAKLDR